MSRRTLLAAGGVLAATALAGCTGSPPQERAEHEQEDEQARAERRLRERAAADSAALLARYDATAAAHPGLAQTLAPRRATTAAHLAELRAPAADAGADADADGSAGGGRPVPAPPAGPEAALNALAEAERGLAESRLAALPDAPPAMARLLASLAAANAVQSRLLAPAPVPAGASS
ncbi:hypothetical protein [Streptomyces sp. YIM 98790]|uniref:hypothetical protein n=1 Tax=Streptomyces sp. YIM 98790 TaxID=2689077 RepID=UPI001FB74FC7|nr:hypothetical protein [Streptomyces sp. YIM 98790]